MSIVSEGAVDALPAQELVVTLDFIYTLGRKRFGVQHTHLKLSRLLSEENGRFFYRFCHTFTSLSLKGIKPLKENIGSLPKSPYNYKRGAIIKSLTQYS
jgi:hypothetical protein